jgi:hypothetical protein
VLVKQLECAVENTLEPPVRKRGRIGTALGDDP